MEPADRVGLFAGWIGVALAAARIGLVLNEDDLLGRARDLVRRLNLRDGGVKRFDHMSGAAGALTGLLALSDVLLDPSLIDASRTARRDDSERRRQDEDTLVLADDQCCTRSEPHRTLPWSGWDRLRPAGAFRASGDQRFRRAAELGFAYERHWFADARRNWPDLCGYRRGVRRSDPLPCGSVWCHGAPGIALSRLRAFEITGDERWKAEALVGLQTTRALTETALQIAHHEFLPLPWPGWQRRSSAAGCNDS